MAIPGGTSEEQIDKTVDDFINEVIDRTNWPLTAAVIWPGKV